MTRSNTSLQSGITRSHLRYWIVVLVAITVTLLPPSATAQSDQWNSGGLDLPDNSALGSRLWARLLPHYGWFVVDPPGYTSFGSRYGGEVQLFWSVSRQPSDSHDAQRWTFIDLGPSLNIDKRSTDSRAILFIVQASLGLRFVRLYSSGRLADLYVMPGVGIASPVGDRRLFYRKKWCGSLSVGGDIMISRVIGLSGAFKGEIFGGYLRTQIGVGLVAHP